MNKKITLIPGWMNTLGTYKKYQGLEIWKDEFNIKEKIETDFIIGHSLGANYAVLKYERFSEAKLILYNPLLPKRNPIDWARRFSKFHKEEGLFKERKLAEGFKYSILGIINALRVTKNDLFLSIEKIPKEKIILIRGAGDNHLCTTDDAKRISEMGIRVIEIPEAGHNWHFKIEEEIEKIINM